LNQIQVVNLGLRLTDVEVLDLESEAVSLDNVAEDKLHDLALALVSRI
jgi:hypothetical protein